MGWAHFDYGALCNAIEIRDKGVCAECGLDTNQLRDRIRKVRRRASKQHYSRGNVVTNRVRMVMMKAGFNADLSQTFSDIDHIVPVWEGGQSTFENLQTLCVPHHKEKTKLEAARRGRVRRLEKKRAARREEAKP